MHAHSPRDNATAHQHAEEVARLLVVMCMLATQKPRHTVVAYLTDSVDGRLVDIEVMHARPCMQCGRCVRLIQITHIEWTRLATRSIPIRPLM